ncbi:TPA: hypothetical protein G8O12_005269 [Salmonella enterica]|uniref:Uncharacterized protein n=1 Tax=Salmonella enterica TaxID=28901 RepID=A0A742L2F7_SALER|nr:hypothetical protein [Salmonella enterica]HAF4642539.1 hypothetical protein [Salmonella enterica]HAF4748118.1 hypothetical protein [Salmonella enterica]
MMVNITFSMILCSLINNHINRRFSCGQIRFPVEQDLRSLPLRPAPSHHNMCHPSGVILTYILCFYAAARPGAQGRKRPLCLFPHRSTLPESSNMKESRIRKKRRDGNSVPFL